jgi:hypothetical protein
MQVVDRIETLSSAKRKEEQLKFIFHWVYKTLRARLASGDQDSESSGIMDDVFYNYYFGDVCKANNATLLQFHRPSMKKRLEAESPKSFNASFIRLITQSDRFMRDFVEALETDLVPHQERIIEWRVRKFFERWQAQYEMSGNDSRIVKALLASMNNCKKFKFPWSVRETVVAREVVQRTLVSQMKEP